MEMIRNDRIDCVKYFMIMQGCMLFVFASVVVSNTYCVVFLFCFSLPCVHYGASSFPGNIKSKDFEIHDSSIGKTAPVCDKSFSQLLGAKPVDGLDHHLPCPEAKHRLLKERTQQYPEHVKHYGVSSTIWPTRTEKGEAHQLVWPGKT
jgi:hypothetical protein